MGRFSIQSIYNFFRPLDSDEAILRMLTETIQSLSSPSPPARQSFLERLLNDKKLFKHFITGRNDLLFLATKLPQPYASRFMEYVLNDEKLFKHCIAHTRDLLFLATELPQLYATNLINHVLTHPKEFRRLFKYKKFYFDLPFIKIKCPELANGILHYILTQPKEFRRLVKHGKQNDNLCHMIRMFPEQANNINDYILGDPQEFDRIFRNYSDICDPEFRTHVVKIIDHLSQDPKAFKRIIKNYGIVYHAMTHEEWLSSAAAKQLMTHILANPEQFRRLICGHSLFVGQDSLPLQYAQQSIKHLLSDSKTFKYFFKDNNTLRSASEKFPCFPILNQPTVKRAVEVIKNEAEIVKNACLLRLAHSERDSLIAPLPLEILIKIAGYTSNPACISKKAAEEIALTVFFDQSMCPNPPRLTPNPNPNPI